MAGRLRPTSQPSRACVLATVALLAGCEVGPDYHAPRLAADAGLTPEPVPGSIGGIAIGGGSDIAGGTRGSGASQALTVGADIAGEWWTLFRSPELNGLMAAALAHNPSLKAAQYTLLQAREQARADEGGLFPTLSAAFGAQREDEAPAALGLSPATARGTPSVFDLFTGTLSVSYTPDIWGGTRRTIEQAQANADYQRYALEAAYLSLTGNIANAAVAEASLRAQIDATEEVLRTEQDGLRVVQAQLDAGAVTRSELLQQQTQVETTLETLPPLQNELAQERDLLATYTGVFPSQYHAPAIGLSSLTLPGALPVSLPSALVGQRPDIEESAAQLHEQTAAVGVATADMLPQVTLSPNVGTDASRIGQMFSAGTLAYSLAAQASQTLFEGGTLLHQRRAAVAAMEAAAHTYQNTVLNAFANVAEALQALQYDATALQVAVDAANAARASLSLLQVQFTAGSVNYLSVLTSEQSEQTALVTLARAEATRYSDTVALFVALGGGWWHRHDVAPKVDACCRLLP